MNKISRLLALVLALALALSLAACGGEPAPAEAPSSEAPAEPAAELAVLKVGASPAPHAEILEQVKPVLAEQGVDLQIVEFTDYVMPNKALDAGDIDANYFQHFPYLDNFNAENGTDLVSAAAIHFEPLGVYPGKTTSLDALADGATIAVPNDPTNEARALLLLQKLGYIKLTDGAGLEATPLDIVENTKNLKFQELEAAQLPNVLPDVDLAIINGNYAILGGLKVADALSAEKADSIAATTYANILAVRAGDENRPELKALIDALKSDQVKEFMTKKYEGAVVPAN